MNPILKDNDHKPCLRPPSAVEGRKSPKDKAKDRPRVAVIGRPNVGKSVLFNALTGKYADVSNYPGTTVEVYRGLAPLGEIEVDLVDTPGMYSISPITEEERVARRILIDEDPDLVVHVLDAKNIDQMLPLTLQALESGLPSVLVLNMMDEARDAGVTIDAPKLSKRLGIPVIPAAGVTGEGLSEIKAAISEQVGKPRNVNAPSSPAVRDYRFSTVAVDVEDILKGDYGLSHRMVAQLAIEQDEEILELINERENADTLARIHDLLGGVEDMGVAPIEYEAALQRQARVREMLDGVVVRGTETLTFSERLSRLTMHPITGLPILLAVLYFGLYQFVGVFGSGTCVDFIETTIFEGYINPFFTDIFTSIIPWAVIQELIVGEYGVLTLGVRYAVAIILPIVTFFFLVFAMIEDSGYLPRLAMLIDRIFKKIGLSGRAVIPIVLGFGCDTMATLVTRTLPTKRERLISTILLSLAIPCSAQLGLILALLSGTPAALGIWMGVMVGVFLVIGWLSAQLFPGGKPSFYMDVPPLRWPRPKNVIRKTYARVKWYFIETLPLFVLASFLIWIGIQTGIFDLMVRGLKQPLAFIGLPAEGATVFIFGFFRRDFGAAGLFDLAQNGTLNNVQIVVAAVALTLFLPCIAQLLINVKERGWKVGMGIAVFVLCLSYAVAWILNFSLTVLKVTL